MNINKKVNTGIFIVVLGLCACNTTTIDTSTNQSEKKMEQQPTTEAYMLTDTYWELITLQSKPIPATTKGKAPHFILNTNDQKVNGYSGCNRFFGGYTLEDDKRIKFGHMGATKRMCFETVINEHEFFQVFEKVNSYKIENDILELHFDQDAPLATFKAVDKKVE